MPSIKQRKKVVILTSVVTQPLREMLDGVIHYSRDVGRWTVYQQESRRWAYQFHKWTEWGADGIVAADNHSVAEGRRIRETGKPCVVLIQHHKMREKSHPLYGLPCVVWDSRAAGRLAADYFGGRRYRSFAYVGDVTTTAYWSLERGGGFRDRLAELGLPAPAEYPAGNEREHFDWMIERPRMMRWLKSLPRGTAVFAGNDRRGKQVLDACDAAGIRVPQNLSILAMDDDSYIYESSIPTLSSIRCQSFDAGYRIAAHLDAPMRGEAPTVREYPVEPVRVVTRQSTDWVAVDDAKVVAMLRKIAGEIGNRSLSADDVVRAAGLSRRAAEIRFMNATGSTIHSEIEARRLDRTKEFLRGTRLPLSEVAERSGFASLTHMGRIFRARFGMTPGEFRDRPRIT